MVAIIVSCVLGAAALLSFLINFNKKRTVMGVFNKMTVSIFFIAVAFFGVMKNLLPVQGVYNGCDVEVVKYGILILVGLVFGMLGDIYLDQKWVYPDDNDKYLYAGFITFGIGHIFYVTALTVKAGLNFKNLLVAAAIGLVVAVVNLGLEKLTKQNYGKFRPIVTLYTFLVTLTPATALVASVVTASSGNALPFIVFTVGGVLFLLSDIILSPMYFKEGQNTPLNFVLNHVTYYLGQYIFALTIVLFPAFDVMP